MTTSKRNSKRQKEVTSANFIPIYDKKSHQIHDVKCHLKDSYGSLSSLWQWTNSPPSVCTVCKKKVNAIYSKSDKVQ